MWDLPSLIQRSFLATLLVPGWSLASDCFPTPDSGTPQYLVAFGSLLYEENRLRKAEQTNLEVPVWVEGYERGWLLRAKPDTLNLTRLSVTPSGDSKFNGVLMSLPASKIASLDRQARLECRVKLRRDNLTPMTSQALPPEGDFWIYQAKPKYIRSPAGEYPIVQSDVDVFLTGCIEQSEHFKVKGFADLCISTTKNWSVHWVNDRRNPIDQKIVQTRNSQVDALLERLQGKFYTAVKAY